MRRIAAVINSPTGQVFTWQRRHFRVAEFLRFLQAVERAYLSAKRIFIALDNWPALNHVVDRWLSQWSSPSQPLLNYLSL